MHRKWKLMNEYLTYIVHDKKLQLLVASSHHVILKLKNFLSAHVSTSVSLHHTSELPELNI